MSASRPTLLDLLLAPVTLPFRGVVFLAEEILRQAERERADAGELRKRLVELQLRHEAGELETDDYLRQWEELAARFAEAGGLERERPPAS